MRIAGTDGDSDFHLVSGADSPYLIELQMIKEDQSTSSLQERTSEELGALFDRVYGELRGMARQIMMSKPAAQTLQPTALVHEAYVRLLHDTEGGLQPWVNRAHFMGAAATAMRRIMIEDARRKQSLRRGGRYVRVNLDTVRVASDADPSLLLALDEAIDRLAKRHPVKAEVVKLLFFGGLTAVEAGEVLGLSDRTIKRHWAFARAWLFEELQE